jgi:hypothetical protein
MSPVSTPPWAPTSMVPLGTGSLTFTAKPGVRPSPNRQVKADRAKSLTAAAAPVTTTPRHIKRSITSAAGREWQNEILASVRYVPELRYIANTTANAASRAWVYPVANENTLAPLGAKTDANEDQESSERGAPEGTVDSEIVKRICLLLVLIGETYLAELPRGRGRPVAGAQERETHILAPMEVTFPRDGYVKIFDVEYPLTGSGAVKLTRIHRPDLENSSEPDSPARSCIPILREIITTSQHVSATGDSRNAGAGVMRYPAEAQTVTVNGVEMPFEQAVAEAMTASVANQDDARRLVPIMIGVPSDIPKEALQWLVPPGTSFDPNVVPLRDNNIRRLALGMDAPPEVLLGAKGLSHFGAWSVEGEFIRLQIAPMLRLIAQALTVAYGIEYTFSTAPLTIRPNLAVEAQALFDREAIGDATLRSATGFSDEDAIKFASKDDEALYYTRKRLAENGSLYQTPGAPAVLDQERILLGLDPINQKYYPSAEEAPLAGSPNKNDEPVGGVNDRENPREAAPAEAPRSNRPVSDGSPEGGADGKRHPVPGTT